MPATGIALPGAQQVFRIVRYTGGLDDQRIRKDVIYGITNLTAEQADADQLAALVRGHWSIDNSVHWVRDVTLRPGCLTRPHRQRPRRCSPPSATSSRPPAGRSLNIAAARRAATLHPRSIIQLLTRSPNPDKSPL